MTDAEIQAQAAGFPDESLTAKLMNAVQDIVLILNSQRQVVFANQALFETLGIHKEQALGYRPGELLDCIHSADRAGGCGTSEFCSTCGAVNAILASQKDGQDKRECRIPQSNGSSLDLKVWTSQLEFQGESYTVFTVTDISHEKRRQSLERIFFHDILNTTYSLQFASYLLRDAVAPEQKELVEKVILISDTLNDEISGQRILAAAENNELEVQLSLVQTLDLLKEVFLIYSAHDLAQNRQLKISQDALNITIDTDRVLLKRVISNLLKNALEASRPGDTVTLGCERNGEIIQFWVHNPGFMPRDVQLQIFQRSFSTKGTGRGLGTYSIRLLTEQYLKGKVGFTSSPESGTRFTVALPENMI